MAGLAGHLRRRIAHRGPLTVAEFMAEVLGHPRHGVYMRADPFGAAGHFTTAPEISQMYGELIGLWCAVVWQSMGGPEPILLVELGPGRGTLAADALRAVHGVPGFRAALRLHLVETSPRLRALQRETLATSGLKTPPAWHDHVGTVPEGPLLVLASEFFDALPIRQFQKTATGWTERLVDVADDGGFRFVLAASPAASVLVPDSLRGAPAGAVVEVSPAALALARTLGGRLAALGGAALIIDYGHGTSGVGDTLQALSHHRRHPPLEDPGSADLTAHVDFAALARAAVEGGAQARGPVTQGRFLVALGIDARATTLSRGAGVNQARDIETARHRLVDPDQMGSLFKVLALVSPGLEPPGFESAAPFPDPTPDP